MVHVLATLAIRPEKIAAFEAAFAELARQVRANEAGCERYELCRSMLDPSTYVVVERYADQAALGEHGQTAYFLDFMSRAAEFVSGAPRIEVLAPLAG